MKQTYIEWVDSTWNPIRGCQAVSAGCANCWAERIAGRFAEKGQTYYKIATMVNGKPKWTGKVQWAGDKFWDPLDWKNPRRILVGNMADLFYPKVDEAWRDYIFGLICMCARHTFLVQTKYVAEMRDYFANPKVWGRIEKAARENYKERYKSRYASSEHLVGPLRNVWLGVSVEDQATADGRIPILQEIDTPLRWVQAAPIIDKISLAKYLQKGRRPKIDWVIADGESGEDARPCDPAWMRQLRDECQASKTAFFLHQWGAWLPATTDQLHEMYGEIKPYLQFWKSGEMSVNLERSDKQTMRKHSEKYGLFLDGVAWTQIPGGIAIVPNPKAE